MSKKTMKPYEYVDESLPVGQRFTREVVERLRESYKHLVNIGDCPPHEYGLALDEIDVLREERDRLRMALEHLTYLYESEQDTEALERVGRPDWLQAALARLGEGR